MVRSKPSAVVELDAYSVEQFCERHSISTQLFYKYRDDMPTTFQVGSRVLISKEAAAAWRHERGQLPKSA